MYFEHIKTEKQPTCVVAVGWTSDNILFTAQDNKKISTYRLERDPEVDDKVVVETESHPLDLKWCVTSRSGVPEEHFAVAFSDGTVKLFHRSGRLERSVAAHEGAAVSLAWNYEGTSLVSVGEDGSVKAWSHQLNLRTRLHQSSSPVYSACWSPDQQSVLFATGSELYIKSLLPGGREHSWKAHDGVVLCCHWSPANGLIVSGGEDGAYKLWDAHGRLLFASAPSEFPVTSVRWHPSGEYFAAGTHDAVLLGDAAGWASNRTSVRTGSVLNLDWSPDGTIVTAAGAGGAICHLAVVGKQVSWDRYEATQVSRTSILVRDMTQADLSPERLDYGPPVVAMAMGYGYLVVATASTIYAYPLHALTTPALIEAKAPAILITLAPSSFLVADLVTGARMYRYGGKLIAAMRHPGLRPDMLTQRTVAVSDDIVAVVDCSSFGSGAAGMVGAGGSVLPGAVVPAQTGDGASSRNRVLLLDATSGRALALIQHTQEICEVALSQAGLTTDRKLTFVDRNRDLYIAPAIRSSATTPGVPSAPTNNIKLGTLVDSAAWHESAEILVALRDGCHVVYTCPEAYFIDKTLAAYTRVVTDAQSTLGRRPVISRVNGSRTHVRRADGVNVVLMHPPAAAQLDALTRRNQWVQAVRLCRVAQRALNGGLTAGAAAGQNEESSSLWAALAIAAIKAGQVDVAEVACAELEEVDKVEFMQSVRALPSEPARLAELKLYTKNVDEAEQILLQSGLIYRAIQMNMRIFRWQRALELANLNKLGVDVVIAKRRQFLTAMQQAENLPAFQALASRPTLDANDIKKFEEVEYAKEASLNRPFVGVLLKGTGSSASQQSMPQQNIQPGMGASNLNTSGSNPFVMEY